MKTYLISFAMWLGSCGGLAMFPRFPETLDKDVPRRVCLRQYDAALECCVYSTPSRSICQTICMSDVGARQDSPCE